jgi:hypothetical protein
MIVAATSLWRRRSSFARSPLGVRVGGVERHVVTLQVIVEEREQASAAARVQDLDLEQVAREDRLPRIERVGHVLPGGHPTDRELREETDVDQARIVALDQDDVRVAAT